jgi:DNA-binding NarL/FixJ family response regulator
MSAKIKGMAKTVLNDANVSVAIVEDNADTRKSWAKLLEAHPRIKCIATCESAEAALKRIPDLCPQVVLMDINLPGMSGIQCAALLKQKLPAVQILMLTAYSDNDYIFEALQAGASGYLLKSTSSPELINSILEVVTGGAPMTGQIARRVIEVFRKSNSKVQEEAKLTARENEILQLLAKGYANKEIASHLECGSGTVRIHLQHIYEKLHVHCRTEATLKYLGGIARMAAEKDAGKFHVDIDNATAR